MNLEHVVVALRAHVEGLTNPENVIGIPASRFEISRQKDLYTCGSRSVYMILQHFGYGIRHKYIKAALGTHPEEGTHEKPMCALFRCLGLNAEIAKLGWSKLHKVLDQGGVVLASVDGDNHYLVVHGLTATAVHVADPFDYLPWRRIISRAEFTDRWDRWGVVVFP